MGIKKKQKRRPGVMTYTETGRLGGLIGGPRRAAALSPERRREIAIIAITQRWLKAKRKDPEYMEKVRETLKNKERVKEMLDGPIFA